MYHGESIGIDEMKESRENFYTTRRLI